MRWCACVQVQNNFFKFFLVSCLLLDYQCWQKDYETFFKKFLHSRVHFTPFNFFSILITRYQEQMCVIFCGLVSCWISVVTKIDDDYEIHFVKGSTKNVTFLTWIKKILYPFYFYPENAYHHQKKNLWRNQDDNIFKKRDAENTSFRDVVILILRVWFSINIFWSCEKRKKLFKWRALASFEKLRKDGLPLSLFICHVVCGNLKKYFFVSGKMGRSKKKFKQAR